MQNGGQSNSQGRDMGQRIEVRRAGSAAHPQPFLTCGFESGIVALALRPQGIDTLKTQAFPVNGKPVVCWNGLILGAAPVFSHCSSFCGYRGKHRPWTGGTDSSISAEFPLCHRWSCHLCAWRGLPRRPDCQQEAF